MPKSRRSASSRRGTRILLLHGPNLNLLGTREPEIYGKESLERINQRLSQSARARGALLEVYQSNHEGQLDHRESRGADPHKRCAA
jgi:3-dehydroquinate dehydratase-2